MVNYVYNSNNINFFHLDIGNCFFEIICYLTTAIFKTSLLSESNTLKYLNKHIIFTMENTKLRQHFSNDTVFNAINKKFISLHDNEVKEVNKYILPTIETLIGIMKSKDSLFKKTYRNIIFCGSFYKGTKVGKPNEFDLNIILNLPINYNYINFSSTQAAFILLNIEHSLCVYDNPEFNKLSLSEKRSFDKFISDGCLDPNKFRDWIKGIIYRVMNTSAVCKNALELFVNNGSSNFIVTIRIKESGPAFTIVLSIPYLMEDIHIDLVPALTFNIELIQQFTSKFYELKECRNQVCFAIPVPLRYIDRNKNLHWRLTFTLQENEILTKYGRAKAIIRQMKKLRDTQNWKNMASYYIETIFLNNLTEFEICMNKISSTLFLFKMLQKLCYACAQHEIKYFWNDNYNLLSKIQKTEMHNINHRLKNIIKDIENNILNDPFVIAKYMLNSNELASLRMEINNQECEIIEDNDDTIETQQKNKRSCIIL